MIETSVIAWILWIFVMVLCHSATARAAKLLPWSTHALQNRTPLFFGVALAPLLMGFTALGALTLLPEKSHHTHLIFIFGLLIVFNIGAYIRPLKKENTTVTSFLKFAWDEKIALFLLAAFAVGLIVDTVFLPLIQNDSLEYATAGRILFDAKNLNSYPPIMPEKYASGFYGPWTHPPLYIAQIYAAYIMQGHADMPGLMRLISPWYALATAGLVFAAGASINRRTGLFAALLFLSTPLLFMGAATSLIDPLPVLGIALLFITLYSFSARPIMLGFLQGGILGITLWTHSQAILFPPLFAIGLISYGGFGLWKGHTSKLMALIGSASIIGVWPYISNYTKLGSLISDNPLIFRITTLAWDDYFLIGRGVNTLTAQIQYGLLKGWFTPEAYGLVFWPMTCALIYFLKPQRLKKWFLFVTGKENATHTSDTRSQPILWAALGMVMLYHAGVLLSIVLGLHQMIRIERYMLIILPCVALPGGWIVASCFSQGSSTTVIRKSIGSLLLVVIALQLVVFSSQLFKASGLYITDIGQNQEQTLRQQPELRAMAFLKEHTPPDAVVLALRASDMYYSNRRMISNIDPRMINFYQAETPQQGFDALNKLGITHVYAVANAQPTFYNSVLQTLLANPHFATLLYSSAGNQLYALTSHHTMDKISQPFDLTPGPIQWINKKIFILGGRKALAASTFSSQLMEGNHTSETQLPLSLFQRDISTILQTASSITVQPDKEYSLRFDLEGYGLVKFWLTQYDPQGNLLSEGSYASPKTLLGEVIIGKSNPHKIFPYRTKTLPNAHDLRVSIEHYGNSKVFINNVSLQLLQ